MPQRKESSIQKNPGGRRKGTGNTRDAILQAAIDQFAERGFEGTTLRAITESVGVDVAMVRHFFGSKQGLFDEAVLDRGDRNVQMLIDAEPNGRPAAQLLEAYFAMWEDERTAQTVRALFRAALESEEHRARLQELLSKRLNESLRLLSLEGKSVAALDSGSGHGTLRTQLIASHLLGVGISRYILQITPLSEVPLEALVEQLTPVIEAYISDH
ncbi:TetR/AcrR family transcriptional regulator [Corynebacterium flavescens]